MKLRSYETTEVVWSEVRIVFVFGSGQIRFVLRFSVFFFTHSFCIIYVFFARSAKIITHFLCKFGAKRRKNFTLNFLCNFGAKRRKIILYTFSVRSAEKTFTQFFYAFHAKRENKNKYCLYIFGGKHRLFMFFCTFSGVFWSIYVFLTQH